MPKGDATYSRGNVDWPMDPSCLAMPNNDCRWLHEVMYRIAVKERSVVIPKRYGADWFATVCQISEDDVRRYVKILVGLDLIGVTPDYLLVVYGSAKQHASMKFKTRDYPEQIAVEVVTNGQWDWRRQLTHANLVTLPPFRDERPPFRDERPPFIPESPPLVKSLSAIDIDIDIDIETENYIVSTETAEPSPVAPAPALPLPPSTKTKAVATQTDEPEDVAILVFPCDGAPREFRLTAEKVREYEDTYRTIDVVTCLRQALQWIRDHPTRKKTHSGMPGFLNYSLKRAVNKGEFKKPEGRDAPPKHLPERIIEDHDQFRRDKVLISLCRALQLKYPRKPQTEILAMAEDQLQRQRDQNLRQGSTGNPTAVADILPAKPP